MIRRQAGDCLSRNLYVEFCVKPQEIFHSNGATSGVYRRLEPRLLPRGPAETRSSCNSLAALRG